jgi:hypothetical protein
MTTIKTVVAIFLAIFLYRLAVVIWREWQRERAFVRRDRREGFMNGGGASGGGVPPLDFWRDVDDLATPARKNSRPRE